MTTTESSSPESSSTESSSNPWVVWDELMVSGVGELIAESSALPAIAVADVETWVDAVAEAHEGVVGDLQSTVWSYEQDLDSLQAESRDADTLQSWLERVVFEAEGQQLDGVDPGLILARLLTELRHQHGVTIPTPHLLSVA